MTTIANPFSGEVIDADDLPALKESLSDIEDFLNELYSRHRRLYHARDELRARIGELEPMYLPKRRNQTEKQQRVMRCSRCSTVILEAVPDSEAAPQTGQVDDEAAARTASAASDAPEEEAPALAAGVSSSPSWRAMPYKVIPEKVRPTGGGDIPPPRLEVGS